MARVKTECSKMTDNEGLGGNPLQSFSQLAKNLQTPIVTLEKQAHKLNMTVRYHRMLQDFSDSESNLITMQVTVTSEIETRRFTQTFQATGTCTKEAKSKAASSAIEKLHSLLPGFNLPIGTIPSTYYDDFFTSVRFCVKEKNLKTMKDIREYIKSLFIGMVKDGFYPCHNQHIMHIIMAFYRFPYLHGCPQQNDSTSFNSKNNPLSLSPKIIEWMHSCLKAGIDGTAILRTLQDDKGIPLSEVVFSDEDDLKYSDIHRVQKLLRNELEILELDEERKLRNFWSCIKEGNVVDVELFLGAGQDPDQPAPQGKITSIFRGQTPLYISACCGHVNTCKLLINQGKCNINVRDKMGRTPVHGAVKHKQPEALKFLVDAGADVHILDNFGNSPLHVAARNGCKESVNFFFLMLKKI